MRGKTPSDPIIFSKYAKVGLNNFIEQHPTVFRRRLSKGPPPQYRWLAWQAVGSRMLKKTKGLYEELLDQIDDACRSQQTDSPKKLEWAYDIHKDLNRTFPRHPLFSKDKFGDIGQAALNNILVAYSIYQPQVGYCQSMNFVSGFILTMSGCNEKDSFWFFSALLQKNLGQ